MVLDGKRLQMSTGETEQEHILAMEQGELMINWEHHRAGLGQAVEITSGADRPASLTSLESSSQSACMRGCWTLRCWGVRAGALRCRPAVYGRILNAFHHARSGLHGAHDLLHLSSGVKLPSQQSLGAYRESPLDADGDSACLQTCCPWLRT